MEIKILDSLYHGTRSINICPGHKVNEQAPIGMYTSSARTTASASAKAKMSYAAIVLEYILTGRVAIGEHISGNEVYVELYDGGTEPAVYMSYKHATNNCHTNIENPGHSSYAVLPVVAYALTSNSGFNKTKEVFEKAADEFVANGSVSESTMFLFCDTFYYEFKSSGASLKYTWTDSFMPDIIKQCIRTRQITSCPTFDCCSGLMKEISIEKVAESAEEKSVTGSTDNDKMYEAGKKGDYILDYCWDMKYHSLIPNLSFLDDYIPQPEFFKIARRIHKKINRVLDRMNEGEFGHEAIRNDYVNETLLGSPGTGKTTLAQALGAFFGVPVASTNPSKLSDGSEFKGMTQVTEGGFKFAETPFLDFYKNGGILVLEEYSLGDQNTMPAAILNAIEKDFMLMEDNSRIVRRHPLFILIITSNPDTQGTSIPNPALATRCPFKNVLEITSNEQLEAILSSRGFNLRNCKKVAKLYFRIQEHLTTINATEVKDYISTRHCFACLELMEDYEFSFKDAAKDTFIGAIYEVDKQLSRDICDAVVEPLA